MFCGFCQDEPCSCDGLSLEQHQICQKLVSQPEYLNDYMNNPVFYDAIERIVHGESEIQVIYDLCKEIHRHKEDSIKFLTTLDI